MSPWAQKEIQEYFEIVAPCSEAQSVFKLHAQSDDIMHFTAGQLTPLITWLYAAIPLSVSNTTTWVFKSDQTATETPQESSYWDF